MVLTVNGTIPGPPIIVYKNQVVVVHITNLLYSDTVTMHWHGIHQKGTPYMDGVGWITQCPIGAGQSFTYRFKVTNGGTYWYHSHVGIQRTNGVYGALIVKEPPNYFNPPVDMLMTVTDWEHDLSEETYTKFILGNFDRRTKIPGLDYTSGLIEGKGRYRNSHTGKVTEAPLTYYNVISGNSYRFRVIAASSTFSLRISIDNHNLTVVATDGYEINPIQVESFIISSGERFDFILTANQEAKNYWIRGESLSVIKPTLHSDKYPIQAILHYEAAPMNEPTTARAVCSKNFPCNVLNCQYRSYPTNEHINCLFISDMTALNKENVPLYEVDSEEHFLNFNYPGTAEVNPGAVNGHIFQYPTTNSLAQGNAIVEPDCSKQNCGEDKACHCNYELKLPFDKTIQLVLLNMGKGAEISHPIHMHGHSFYVLKMEYISGNTLVHPDIECGTSSLQFCNYPKWKNSSWNGGNVPGLNVKQPIRKDTLFLPVGAYAVIRIRSDNPGKWFIHCHVDIHAQQGMAMVLSEAPEKVPLPPYGFPTCENFKDVKKDATGRDDANQDTERLMLIAFLCLVSLIVLLELFVILHLMKRRKYTRLHESTN